MSNCHAFLSSSCTVLCWFHKTHTPEERRTPWNSSYCSFHTWIQAAPQLTGLFPLCALWVSTTALHPTCTSVLTQVAGAGAFSGLKTTGWRELTQVSNCRVFLILQSSSQKPAACPTIQLNWHPLPGDNIRPHKLRVRSYTMAPLPHFRCQWQVQSSPVLLTNWLLIRL